MNNDNNYNNPSHTFCIYSAFRKFHLISAQKMLSVGRCAICQQSNKPQGKQCTVMTCPNTKASLLVSVNYSISCQPCGFMRQHPVAGNTRVDSLSRKVHRGRNFLLARVEHSVLTHYALSSNQKVSFNYSNVELAADWISAITWIVRFSCISDFDWLVSKLTNEYVRTKFQAMWWTRPRLFRTFCHLLLAPFLPLRVLLRRLKRKIDHSEYVEGGVGWGTASVSSSSH